MCSSWIFLAFNCPGVSNVVCNHTIFWPHDVEIDGEDVGMHIIIIILIIYIQIIYQLWIIYHSK
jgi:hypothetical protein